MLDAETEKKEDVKGGLPRAYVIFGRQIEQG